MVLKPVDRVISQGVDTDAGVSRLVDPAFGRRHLQEVEPDQSLQGHVHLVHADVEHAGDPSRVGAKILETGELEDGEVIPIGDERHRVAGEKRGGSERGVLGFATRALHVTGNRCRRETEGVAERFDAATHDRPPAAKPL